LIGTAERTQQSQRLKAKVCNELANSSPRHST